MLSMFQRQIEAELGYMLGKRKRKHNKKQIYFIQAVNQSQIFLSFSRTRHVVNNKHQHGITNENNIPLTLSS